jgi:hypothetical protein
MPYVIGRKSLAELNQESVNDLKAYTGLDDIGEQSTLKGIIKAINKRLDDVYASLEANFYATYTRTSSGPWLDEKAAELGIEREVFFQTRVPCESETFILTTSDGSTLYSALGISSFQSYAVIPKGMVIRSTSQDSLTFITDETALIRPADKRVCLGASSELDDQALVSAGTMDILEIDGVSLFTSTSTEDLELIQDKAITGIETVESDESLRLRISLAKTALATGNEASVVSSTLANPEIASIFIDRNVRGTGSADIIAYPRFNRVSESTLRSLESDMRQNAAFGSNIRVIQPDYIPVSVALNTNGSSTSIAGQAVSAFVKDINNKRITYRILENYLANNGITAKVTRLTVDNRDILPQGSVTLLNSEIYELKPRNDSEPAVSAS